MPNRLKLIAASLATLAAAIPAAADAQYYGGGREAYAARNGYQRGDYYADNGYYARPGRRYGRPVPAYDGPPPGYYREDYRGGRAQRRCDRGAGTIVGAGVGALAGRAIDRDC